MTELSSQWRKSSKSDTNGACVETATANGAVLVRDTTNRSGGTIGFTTAAWSAFLGAVKRG
jgi:Domain of unknown function (DUF397)